jgi:hypothetical protein
MSEFVMVKRERAGDIIHLLETMQSEIDSLLSYSGATGGFGGNDKAIDELRAVLAQEAGHVEELLGMVEPTAWLLDGSVGGSSLDFQITDLLETQNRHGGCLVPLFRVPPAPVAVDERAEFEKWLRNQPHVVNLGFNRSTGKYVLQEDEDSWQAWQARACLDKVKELNQ